MENNTWGKAVVEKALSYAEHKWYPTDKNVMHGVDENGRYVDTPDITWKGELLNCGWWKPNEIRELHMDGEMLLLLRSLTKELQMENMRVMFQKIPQDMEVGIQLVLIALGY